MNTRYTNPVYPHECADPFVLSFNGSFWCYRTGHWRDGRIFGILRSPDLVHWEAMGGAMAPLPEGNPHYWAPEVTYDNGVFYLYYSTGNEVNMHLRVATSDRPEGPFIDSGRRLTREQFAIDAHVLIDDDGSRYMFYATDFLDYERVGTGTVVDHMIDPFTLAGKPLPVTRAKYDWQIFDPCRAAKGSVCWHTIEGSFVLKHKGRYYQMFSGGNYQNKSYGVGYAVTDQVYREKEWDQHIDGKTIFPVLRTVPGKVKGPGHNSVVLGPDHRQWFCTYHVILPQAKFERVLAVDRLEWVGERMVVLGPSHTSQLAPIQPVSLADQLFETVGEGTWKIAHTLVAQTASTGQAEAVFALEHPYFLFQSYARCLESAAGQLGAALLGKEGQLLRVTLDIPNNQVLVEQPGDRAVLPLPGEFDSRALHRWQIEVNGSIAGFRMDSGPCQWSGMLPGQPLKLALFTASAAAEFSTPDLTYGWEDRFDQAGLDPAELGWIAQGSGQWAVTGKHLVGCVAADQSGRLVKHEAFTGWEWVINLRLVKGSGLSLYPAVQGDGHGPELRLSNEQGRWKLEFQPGGSIDLPEDFDGTQFQQLRLRRQDGMLRIAWLEQELAAWPLASGAACTGLGVDPGAEAEFDLDRLTRD